MKVFLTGDRQTGKSTAIRIFTEKLGFQPGGFCTKFDRMISSDAEALYLVPFSPDTHNELPEEPVAVRHASHFPQESRDAFSIPACRGEKSGDRQPAWKDLAGHWDVNTGAFNRIGVKILSESSDKPLIIMDELGFLERDAFALQDAVLFTLSGKSNALGVVKPLDIPFLNKVRECADHIIEVTAKNRDGIPALLSSLFARTIVLR